MTPPTLDPSELVAVTGYTRAAEQLAELQRLGFVRARIDRLGRVVLERAHYEAVCDGRFAYAPQNINSRNSLIIGRGERI